MILDEVHKIFNDIFGEDYKDMSLCDIDSLEMLDLILECEDKFHVMIDENDIKQYFNNHEDNVNLFILWLVDYIIYKQNNLI